MTLETWTLDGTRSGVRFSVRHLLVAKVSGRFAQWRGSMRVADGVIDFASLELIVQSASVDTGLDRRDLYLRSPHFLNVAAYPSLLFAARHVKKGSNDQVCIVGGLTIRGATRDAVFEVEDCLRSRDRQGNEHASFAMKASIDRRDFGLTWNGALDLCRATLLSDHVEIEVEVIAANRHFLPGDGARPRVRQGKVSGGRRPTCTTGRSPMHFVPLPAGRRLRRDASAPRHSRRGTWRQSEAARPRCVPAIVSSGM